MIRDQWFRIIVFLFLGMSVSCATSFDKRGQYHTIHRGETMWTIARSYRVDPQILAEYNNIEDPQEFHVGLKLYIPPRVSKPGYKKVLFEAERGSGVSHATRKFKQRKERNGETSLEVYHGRFLWPVDGPVTSGFGIRNGRKHEGIDIGVPSGTLIKAADAGYVAFSGKMRGYGNLILLRHDDAFITAYAHNTKNKVNKGQSVKKGELIATVGRTGRATAPNLHFEVRQGEQARNPLFFLPKKKK